MLPQILPPPPAVVLDSAAKNRLRERFIAAAERAGAPPTSILATATPLRSTIPAAVVTDLAHVQFCDTARRTVPLMPRGMGGCTTWAPPTTHGLPEASHPDTYDPLEWRDYAQAAACRRGGAYW